MLRDALRTSHTQVQLYQAALAAGITLLSIGHRPALRNFHSVAVHFDGHQVG